MTNLSVTHPSISALIIARNEEAMLDRCLETLRWCDEIIVLDDGSDDRTREIAESHGATVISFKHQSFARLREAALKKATSEWVLYIDADERVTPQLAKEIAVNAETETAQAFEIQRSNIFFGTPMDHGGWNADYVTRVFKRSALKGWEGMVHESPKHEGERKRLASPLIHLTHRSVSDGLQKSIRWTAMEAEMLAQAIKYPVTFWTVLRKGVMEFLRRGVFKRGYKDGQAGLMESLTQGINRMLVYMQVWERQQTPSITDQYQEIEKAIQASWQEET